MSSSRRRRDHRQAAPTSTPTSCSHRERVSPARGPTLRGAAVMVTRTGSAHATAVLFGTADPRPSPSCPTPPSPPSAPAGSPGVVDVRVRTTSGGFPTSSADQFTYMAPPAVSNVDPDEEPLRRDPRHHLRKRIRGCDRRHVGDKPSLRPRRPLRLRHQRELAGRRRRHDRRRHRRGPGRHVGHRPRRSVHLLQDRLRHRCTRSTRTPPAAGGTPVTITGTGLTDPQRSSSAVSRPRVWSGCRIPRSQPRLPRDRER